MTYYDQISEGYEELHKEEQEKKLSIIKQHIRADPDDQLLDVGCGTGLTTEPWGCIKTGIDPAKKLIEKAKAKKTKTEYIVAGAEKIPFPDNKFDIVISVTAIQNFRDIKKGLQEMHRVGKNKFALTFLKNSKSKEKIMKIILNLFEAEMIIEEDKDMIIIAHKW